MSVPPVLIPASLSTSGYEDGLGRRTLIFDRETGGIMERLQLRPELAAFERSIKERVELAAAFDDERFAHARSVERDSRSGAVLIVSEFVPGNRLSDVLDVLSVEVAEDVTGPGLDAALGFLLDVLPALTAFHAATGFTHGAVGPGRTVVTPAGQVVLLDWMFGHALERLKLNRLRLWRELGIAMPATPGGSRFDGRSDVAQAALTAVMIVIGRLLRVDEYPDGLTAIVSEVVDIAQIRGSARFATGLQRFLHRALPLTGSRPFASAEEADTALQLLAREIGVSRCRTALAAFVSEFNRVREIKDLDTEWEPPAGYFDQAHAEPPAALTVMPENAPSTVDEAETETETETARSVSAALEFEIELDDVLSASDASQDDEVDPVLYEIALMGTPDEAALLAYPMEDVDDQHAPVSAPPLFDPPLFAASPAEPSPITPLYEPPLAYVPDEPAPTYVPEETAPPAGIAQPYENVETFARVDLPVPAPVEEIAHIPASTPAEPAPTPVGYADLGLFSAPIGPPAEEPSIAAALPQTPYVAPFVETLVVAPPPFVAPLVAAPPVLALPVVEPTPVAIVDVPPVMEAPSSVRATEPSARERRRGARRHRDKLRSNAKPADVQAPVPAPMPRRSPPPPAPPPMPYYPPVFDSRESPPAAAWTPPAPTPIVAPPVIQVRPAPAPAAVRVKSEAPAGYAPPSRRGERHESDAVSALPYVSRGVTAKVSSSHWKLGAAAALVLAVGAGALARPYLTDRAQPQAVPAAVPAPAPAPAQKIVAAASGGSLILVTQPAGARVLLDGNFAGETPLTIESVTPGRHTVTFVTASGSVRKNVRVEAGKAVSLDVPVYSGWIAVFTPVLLDIAEGGRSIGTSEQGRLMLAPGKHQLTFSNRDLGYSSSQTVDIEPGEEKSLSIQATGELNLNALPWAEVWIDGQKAGDTPLAKLKVPLGTHEIVFKHPQFPDRKLTTTVRANAPTAATVDFNKAP